MHSARLRRRHRACSLDGRRPRARRSTPSRANGQTCARIGLPGGRPGVGRGRASPSTCDAASSSRPPAPGSQAPCRRGSRLFRHALLNTQAEPIGDLPRSSSCFPEGMRGPRHPRGAAQARARARPARACGSTRSTDGREPRLQVDRSPRARPPRCRVELVPGVALARPGCSPASCSRCSISSTSGIWSPPRPDVRRVPPSQGVAHDRRRSPRTSPPPPKRRPRSSRAPSSASSATASSRW